MNILCSVSQSDICFPGYFVSHLPCEDLQCWRPQLIKDIQKLERIQRRATKYILNNYDLSYKQRLDQLHLLPLMYTYELNDLMYKSLVTGHYPLYGHSIRVEYRIIKTLNL